MIVSISQNCERGVARSGRMEPLFSVAFEWYDTKDGKQGATLSELTRRQVREIAAAFEAVSYDNGVR